MRRQVGNYIGWRRGNHSVVRILTLGALHKLIFSVSRRLAAPSFPLPHCPRVTRAQDHVGGCARMLPFIPTSKHSEICISSLPLFPFKPHFVHDEIGWRVQREEGERHDACPETTETSGEGGELAFQWGDWLLPRMRMKIMMMIYKLLQQHFNV